VVGENCLVVSNMNGLFSISYMGYIILPIDELHHFSRWLLHMLKPDIIPDIIPSGNLTYVAIEK